MTSPHHRSVLLIVTMVMGSLLGLSAEEPDWQELIPRSRSADLTPLREWIATQTEVTTWGSKQQPCGLRVAISRRNDAALALLIAAGHPLNSRYQRQSILEHAFRIGHDEAALQLLQAGATLDDDPSGTTALRRAMAQGCERAAVWLLQHEADPLAQPPLGPGQVRSGSRNDSAFSLFLRAREINHPELIDAMVMAINDINAVLAESPLLMNQAMSALEPICSAIIKQLDNDFRDRDGATLLHHWAASRHMRRPQVKAFNMDIFAEIIRRGFDNEALNARGQSALHTAAGVGQLVSIRALIDLGFDLNLRDADGNTPLHQFLQFSSVDVSSLAILLEAGADPTLVNGKGEAPLFILANRRQRPQHQIAAASLLRFAGADPAGTNAEGRTAVDAAFRRQGDDLVLWFASHGYPLRLSLRERIEEMLTWNQSLPRIRKEIESHEVDIATANLLLSHGAQHPILGQLGLEHGADPNVFAHHGTTPILHAVLWQSRWDLALNLLAAGATVSFESNNRDPLPILGYRQRDLSTGPQANPEDLAKLNTIIQRLVSIYSQQRSAEQLHAHLAALLQRDALPIAKLLHESGAPLQPAAALWNAAERHLNTEIIAWLLAHGAGDPPGQERALTRFVAEGNTDAVALLLEAGTTVPTGHSGRRLLNAASAQGADMLRLLFKHGLQPSPEVGIPQLPDVDQAARPSSRPATTPLHQAIIANQPTAVALLLENGSPTEVFDTIGFTPLHLAAQSGNLEIIRLLLAAGADPAVVSKPMLEHPYFYVGQRSALHCAVLGKASSQVLQALVQAGVPLDLQDDHGLTALGLAQVHDNEILAELLLAAGAATTLDNASVTSIKRAVRVHRNDLQALLAAITEFPEIPTVAVTDGSDTIIEWTLRELQIDRGNLARQQALTEFFNQLLAHGYPVNHVNPLTGYAPIHLTVAHNNLQQTQVLIAAGANVNLPCAQHGYLPLMRLQLTSPNVISREAGQAHRETMIAIAKTLITAGADLGLESRNHIPLAYWIVRNVAGKNELIELLIESGSPLDWVSQGDGGNLLHRLRWREPGDLALGKRFIAAGAAVDHQNHRGETPLHRAVMQGSAESVQMLLEHGADVVVNVRDDEGRTVLDVVHNRMEGARKRTLLEAAGGLTGAASAAQESGNEGNVPAAE